MNRLTFIGQTYQGTMVSVDDVIKFFDHTMAAYELVESIDDLQVHGITDPLHSSLTIQVESPNLAKLHEVVAYINETIHNRKDVYGKSFVVEAAINGSLVDLFVREI